MRRFLKQYDFFFKYTIKFIGIFLILYYGTMAVIGLAAPEGYYAPFIAHYLNYTAWLRSSLFFGVQQLLALSTYTTIVSSEFTIRIWPGPGVHLGYSCLGYGVSSFWIAFVVANETRLTKKITWVFSGILLLWCVNVLRISLLVIAIHKNGAGDFLFDHHTWFNIVSYGCIFTGMYCFDKNINKSSPKLNEST